MFIDYSSGKAALQAMDDLVPFLRDHYGPSRPIKPLAYIKGGDTSGRGADKAGSKSERKAAVTATRPVAERANDSDFCERLPLVSDPKVFLSLANASASFVGCMLSVGVCCGNFSYPSLPPLPHFLACRGSFPFSCRAVDRQPAQGRRRY